MKATDHPMEVVRGQLVFTPRKCLGGETRPEVLAEKMLDELR